MNYIKQVNTFYKLLQNNPLSPKAQCLYLYLLNKNNDFFWVERFTVSNLSIMAFTGLSESDLKRVRNELKQKGYIEYTKRSGNNSGIYSIKEFVVQYEPQIDLQYDLQNEPKVNDKVNTLNKLKIKQKNDSSNDEELKKHFTLIWEIYPNKKGKAKAEGYFLQWIKGRKINGSIKRLTDRQMYLAVQKYKEECEEKEIHQQFIKHGDTFFNTAILDYMEENSE